MAESRTQIVIALIGLVGILGAAVISRYGLPSSITGTKSSTSGASNGTGANTSTGSNTPRPPDNDPDSVRILSVNPPPGTLLKIGQRADFDVYLTYRLQSLDNGALSIQIVQFDNSPSCAGASHIPAAQHVSIARGEQKTLVKVSYPVGGDKEIVKSGSVSITATLWKDFNTHQVLKHMEFHNYCWTFN